MLRACPRLCMWAMASILSQSLTQSSAKYDHFLPFVSTWAAPILYISQIDNTIDAILCTWARSSDHTSKISTSTTRTRCSLANCLVAIISRTVKLNRRHNFQSQTCTNSERCLFHCVLYFDLRFGGFFYLTLVFDSIDSVMNESCLLAWLHIAWCIITIDMKQRHYLNQHWMSIKRRSWMFTMNIH